MLLLPIKCSLIIFSLSLATIGCQSISTLSTQQSNTVSTAATKESIKDTLPAFTGLPITSELLEQYYWQLVSAVSNSFDKNGQLIRKPMGNFYHPDYPISVSFGSYPDSQYVYFNSNCNGSGAPYTLLKNNTFKVDSIVSTDMGCSETGNRIESALFDLMNGSSSKLTLSLQPKKQTSTISADFPQYNLLQTMDSGETLVWQNAKKDKPQ